MGDPQRPFIGCTLSLVSKAKIRYTGTLASIDTANTTLTLNKVQSHGTEDRIKDKCIPPTPGTYDLIIFNGHDIEDLQVIPKEEPIQDPAILNAQKHKEVGHGAPGTIGVAPATLKGNGGPQRQAPQRPDLPKESHGRMGNNMHQLGHDADHSAFSKPNANYPREHPRSAADAVRRQPGPPSNSGASHNSERTAAQLRKAEQQKKQKQQMEKFKEDFDWSAGNAKFDVLKEELAKELGDKLVVTEKKKSRKKSKESKGDDCESSKGDTVAEGEEVKEVKSNASEASAESGEDDENAYYQPKKSFFDSISCEATEGRNQEGPKMSRFQERKLNAETFGIPEHPNYRGRGRGGFRGGYRGNNNRGGYNNRYNRGGYNNNDRYQGNSYGNNRYDSNNDGYGRPRYNQYSNNGFQGNRRYGGHNQGQWNSYNNYDGGRPRQSNAL